LKKNAKSYYQVSSDNDGFIDEFATEKEAIAAINDYAKDNNREEETFLLWKLVKTFKTTCDIIVKEIK
jgi:hypothetical protein